MSPLKTLMGTIINFYFQTYFFLIYTYFALFTLNGRGNNIIRYLYVQIFLNYLNKSKAYLIQIFLYGDNRGD